MFYTHLDINESEPILSKKIRQEISNLNSKVKVVAYWEYGRLFININDSSLCVIIYQNKVDTIDFSNSMQEAQIFGTDNKDENETLIAILQLLNQYFAKQRGLLMSFKFPPIPEHRTRKQKKDLKRVVKESFQFPHDNKRIHEYGNDLIIIVSTNKPQSVCIKYKQSELDYSSSSILKYYIGCWNDSAKMHKATEQIVNDSVKLNALWIRRLA